ncbi:MAG: M20/M25/M40 family metallo-hydrolase [Gemmatimonadota bacterium]|nr:MAG: M20/M25/M40 family metallo-hydrolase [Gemmatimonadota bacterium]
MSIIRVAAGALGGLALLAATAVQAQAQMASVEAPAARVTADLQVLAADSLEGRGVGTAGLDAAAAYIARAFEESGLAPAGNEGYYQVFEISPTAPGVAHTNLGGSVVKNVVGVLEGRGSLADEVVVIGAHYDHLGYGGGFSLDPDSAGVVHNGADDNGSGTAALLEAARILGARTDTEQRTIVFIAFTAEELGTIGSQYYAANPTHPGDRTYAMVNMDMVGRLQNDSLIVIGVGSAPELPGIIDSLNQNYGFVLSSQEDPWGRSDHSSFYAHQIPVVHLFTNVHEDYHRTTDDWEKINVEGVAKIARFAADLTWTLAQRGDILTYVEVPKPAPPQQGGRRASLGTIPDMTDSPGGVRLTGVRSESAADEAGLRAGDIIVQIGDHEVKDLMGLQQALMAHQGGDVVTIVFLRDGERMETTATLR